MHYPYAGGVWQQDNILMVCVETAYRAWYIYHYKPKHKMAWTGDDRDFIAWVNEYGST